MQTELQVSSLNQSFLPEMGTTQQNSLSKHGHNCLSETLASSLLTVFFVVSWHHSVTDVFVLTEPPSQAYTFTSRI